jgi:hypothetical protein
MTVLVGCAMTARASGQRLMYGRVISSLVITAKRTISVAPRLVERRTQQDEYHKAKQVVMCKAIE